MAVEQVLELARNARGPALVDRCANRHGGDSINHVAAHDWVTLTLAGQHIAHILQHAAQLRLHGVKRGRKRVHVVEQYPRPRPLAVLLCARQQGQRRSLGGRREQRDGQRHEDGILWLDTEADGRADICLDAHVALHVGVDREVHSLVRCHLTRVKVLDQRRVHVEVWPCGIPVVEREEGRGDKFWRTQRLAVGAERRARETDADPPALPNSLATLTTQQ